MGLKFTEDTVKILANSRQIADIKGSRLVTPKELFGGIAIHPGYSKELLNEEIDNVEHRSGRGDCKIIIAEDSILLNRLIVDSLSKAGYTNIIHTANGKECYDKIMEFKANGTLKDNISLVITDIEMPKMDGHRLTKLVKSDDDAKKIPVIIFSSLINDEMRRKGEQLGADAQLTKPEIGRLVEAIDTVLGRA